MIEFAKKRVLVVGLGSSGEAAARVLLELCARPVLIDSSYAPARVEAVGALREAGVEVRLGVSVPDDIGSFDLVVASPGVPQGAPVLARSRHEGLKVVSELELGYRLLEENTFVAVTGTDGKTTTTRLVVAMLNRPGRRALECGNIGTPVVSLRGCVDSGDILVCEASSFQLQNIEKFRAKVSLVLNLAPDHFDWHENIEDYGRAKMRVIENMLPDDFLVYNADDSFCRQVASRANGVTIGFSSSESEEAAIRVVDGWIVTGAPLPQHRVLDTAGLKIAGSHNVENVMAAAGAALILGEDPSRVRDAAYGFKGLEHRCERVAVVGGVSFYNDSKATNPHAALSAVRSFSEPFVAIMGGRNKGLEFTELATAMRARMDDGMLLGVVLLGESSQEIEDAIHKARGHDVNRRVVVASDMEDSVRKAYEMATSGASVLFAPACASFDMFSDYKERGESFKAAVGMLEEGEMSGGAV